MSTLQFNLKKNSIPVVIEDGDATPLNLTLVEMSAAQRDQYLDSIQARMGYDVKGSPTGLKKFDGLQADLLTRCLLKEDGKMVTREQVQGWPSSIVSDLFKAAQKLNHLNKEEDEEKQEKKD